MSDVCVVMELVGNNVLRKWLSIISLKAASDEAEDTVSDLHTKTVYGSASQQVGTASVIIVTKDCAARQLRRTSVTSSPPPASCPPTCRRPPVGTSH